MEKDPKPVKKEKEPKPIKKKLLKKGERIILWIDANIKSKSNQATLEQMKQIPNVIVEEATSVDDGFEILRTKYHLTVVLVVVSGALSQEYMDRYEKELKRTSVLTANMIYCGNAQYHVIKVFANDKFFNPGSVETKKGNLLSFLSDAKFTIKYEKESEDGPSQSEKEKWGFSFTKVEKLEELAVPSMLGKFVSEEDIDPKQYEEFLSFVKNYKMPKLDFFAGPVRNMEINIPYYLNSKFFLYLYSMETKFYYDMNKKLSTKSTNMYNPFIYSLYMGLKEGYIENYSEGRLFRGTRIAESELKDLMKNLEESKKKKASNGKNENVVGNKSAYAYICNSNCFLSFSKNEEVANMFLDARRSEEKKTKASATSGLVYCKFIIEPLTDAERKSGFFVSNIVLGDCTASKSEEEVLILPFSCFKVEDIHFVKNEDFMKCKGRNFGLNDVTTITLKYLIDYEKRIKEFLKWQKPGDVKTFLTNASKKEGEFIQNENEGKKGAKKEGKLQSFYQKNVIVWIDQFVNCELYSKLLEDNKNKLKDFTVMKANTVEKGYQILRMLDNQFTYVIVSAYLSKEFMGRYEKEAKENGLVTANIILCENSVPTDIPVYQKQKFIGDDYVNPGGFIIENKPSFNFPKAFQKALDYILKDETGFKAKVRKPISETIPDWGTSFKQTDTKANMWSQILGVYEKNPKKLNEDLEKFAEYIFNRYKNLQDLGYPTKEKKMNIPLYCYTTNFLKMYVSDGAKLTDKDNFFVNMNKELTNEKYEKYLPYIYVMYSAAKNKILESCNEAIYKGTKLKKSEIAELENVAKDKRKIIWTKPFLTCTKNEKFAIECLKDYEEREGGDEDDREEEIADADAVKVKFVINPAKGGILVSNMNTGRFRRLGDDEEIVIFPFTPFKISEVKKEKGKDYTTLILDYYSTGTENKISDTVEEGRFEEE